MVTCVSDGEATSQFEPPNSSMGRQHQRCLAHNPNHIIQRQPDTSVSTTKLTSSSTRKLPVLPSP
eukprot:8394546-Prorocentrum_lima.AAC.1